MFIIIDIIEHEIYYFEDNIAMGVDLDIITNRLNTLHISHILRYYNNGKIVSIRKK
jgi:hypothetical protein